MGFRTFCTSLLSFLIFVLLVCFQAEDRDDMLAWINSIQVSGNHDNQDGKVIINEDLILRKTSQIESG